MSRATLRGPCIETRASVRLARHERITPLGFDTALCAYSTGAGHSPFDKLRIALNRRGKAYAQVRRRLSRATLRGARIETQATVRLAGPERIPLLGLDTALCAYSTGAGHSPFDKLRIALNRRGKAYAQVRRRLSRATLRGARIETQPSVRLARHERITPLGFDTVLRTYSTGAGHLPFDKLRTALNRRYR